MVPNPFDLRGPEFLCFYAGLIVCVGAALWALRDLGGNGPAAASRERMPEITDPYLVSCLRGGREEVWRLATVTLIDRGLLKVKENNEVKTRSKADPSHGQNDVERAAINWFKTPHPAESIFKQKELLALAEPYEKQLEALGLRPDAALRSARLVRHWLAWLALVGVAGWKIHLALARGHSNIGFLIVLAIAGLFIVSIAAGDARRITERGKALLNDLHGLFGRLKEQGPTTTRRAGQATQELVWLAAVFGVAALPVAQFAYAQQLYPAPVSSSGGTGGDSSSSSSSCGSSCGGGGCGGGCGGCGS
jgi:uncharacterized protein (TIGR04222 family)